MDRFISLSIQIANTNPASICQIALVTFENGIIVEEWSTCINPEMDFLSLAVKVHAITPDRVAGAPNFLSIYPEIHRRINGSILVFYNQFDIDRFEKALARYGLPQPAYMHLDMSKVVRTSYTRHSALPSEKDKIVQFMEIPLKHREAKEIACEIGEMLINICEDSGLSVSGWISELKQSYHLTVPKNPTKWHDRTGNPNGRLYGHIVSFAGVFAFPRHMMAMLASERGCHISSHIHRNTTILVTGNMNVPSHFFEEDKHRYDEAKKWIEEGYPIQLMTELEFCELLEPSDPTLN